MVDRAGIIWDSVVEEVWKYIGGSREVWEGQGRSSGKGRHKGKASAKKQGAIGETIRDERGIKRRDRNENVFALPNGSRKR